jgi:hypothetical protein
VSIAMAVGRTEGMVRMGRMGIGDGRQSGLLSFALPVGGCVWASAGAASYRPGGRDQRVAGMGDLPTSMGYGPPWSAFLASGGGGPGGGRPGLRHPASGGAGAGGADVGRWLSTQLLLDHGGLFTRWAPYAPISSFTYHFGFHSAVAALAWLTGWSASQAVLWGGQILNALATLSLYPLAVRLADGSRWAGAVAVLLPALLWPMPMFYVN